VLYRVHETVTKRGCDWYWCCIPARADTAVKAMLVWREHVKVVLLTKISLNVVKENDAHWRIMLSVVAGFAAKIVATACICIIKR
jgi:hypothetical protein